MKINRLNPGEIVLQKVEESGISKAKFAELVGIARQLANKLRKKDTLGGIISFIVRMRNDLNTGLYVYTSSVKFNSDTIDKYCQLLKETNNPQALEITGFIRSLKY